MLALFNTKNLKKLIISLLASLMLATVVVPASTTVVYAASYGSWVEGEKNALYNGQLNGSDTGASFGESSEIEDIHNSAEQAQRKSFIVAALDFIVGGLTDLFVGKKISQGQLLSEITAIILGKVGGGVAAADDIYAFRFDMGNVFGMIGAQGYQLIRWMCLTFMALMFVIIVGRATLNTGSGQAKNLLKSQLLGFVICFFALALWPNILDILIYLRDFSLKSIYSSPIAGSVYSAQTGQTMQQQLDTLKGDTANAANILIVLGSHTLVLYFRVMYVGIALTMTILFIVSPVLFVTATQNKHLLEQWFMTVLGTLMTPIIDFILILIVFIVPAQDHPYLQLAAAASVIPTRGLIRQVLGMGAGAASEGLGIGAMMAGAKLARAAVGAVTGGIAAIGGAVTDLNKANEEEALDEAEKGGASGDVSATIKNPTELGGTVRSTGEALDRELESMNGGGGSSEGGISSIMGGSAMDAYNKTQSEKEGISSPNSNSKSTSSSESSSSVKTMAESISSSSSSMGKAGSLFESDGSSTKGDGLNDIGHIDKASSSSGALAGAGSVASAMASITGGTDEGVQDKDKDNSDENKPISEAEYNRRKNLENMDAIRDDNAKSFDKLNDKRLDIAQAQKDVAALERDNASATQKIEEQRRIKDNAERQIANLNDGKSNIELPAEVKGKAIQEQMGRVATAEGQIKNLQAKIDGNSSQIRGKKAMIASAQADIGAIQSHMASNNTALAQAQSVERSFAAGASGGMGQSFDSVADYQRAARVQATREKFANISNFTMPEYANSLSHSQMADMYRKRAVASIAKTAAGGVIGATGAVVGVGAALPLGVSASMYGAAIGGEIGGTVGTGGVDLGIKAVGAVANTDFTGVAQMDSSYPSQMFSAGVSSTVAREAAQRQIQAGATKQYLDRELNQSMPTVPTTDESVVSEPAANNMPQQPDDSFKYANDFDSIGIDISGWEEYSRSAMGNWIDSHMQQLNIAETTSAELYEQQLDVIARNLSLRLGAGKEQQENLKSILRQIQSRNK